jgi:TnpA family transposase
MADASRGLGYLHLVNVAQWHISDDNYVAARAAIVDTHHKHPMAGVWDDGTTSPRMGNTFGQLAVPERVARSTPNTVSTPAR